MRTRIAVAVVSVVVLPFVDLTQNWEVIAPLCIALNLGREGPRVWMFGDHDALWDTVFVSVDGDEASEVFIASPRMTPRPNGQPPKAHG